MPDFAALYPEPSRKLDMAVDEALRIPPVQEGGFLAPSRNWSRGNAYDADAYLGRLLKALREAPGTGTVGAETLERHDDAPPHVCTFRVPAGGTAGCLANRTRSRHSLSHAACLCVLAVSDAKKGKADA